MKITPKIAPAKCASWAIPVPPLFDIAYSKNNIIGPNI